MVAVTGLFLFALSAIPAHAAEKVTVKTGYLTCHEAAGWGFVIGSSHSIHCTYTSNTRRRHPAAYDSFDSLSNLRRLRYRIRSLVCDRAFRS
jgi:hypothetical protein